MVRLIVTSAYSIGSAPSELSIVSSTSARPSGGRPAVPAKMTSSILPPRRDLAPCSPITQARASTTLDLPEPLGPTMQVMPGSSCSVVVEANDLNPRSVRLLRYKAWISPHEGPVTREPLGNLGMPRGSGSGHTLPAAAAAIVDPRRPRGSLELLAGQSGCAERTVPSAAYAVTVIASTSSVVKPSDSQNIATPSATVASRTSPPASISRLATSSDTLQRPGDVPDGPVQSVLAVAHRRQLDVGAGGQLVPSPGAGAAHGEGAIAERHPAVSGHATVTEVEDRDGVARLGCQRLGAGGNPPVRTVELTAADVCGRGQVVRGHVHQLGPPCGVRRREQRGALLRQGDRESCGPDYRGCDAAERQPALAASSDPVTAGDHVGQGTVEGKIGGAVAQGLFEGVHR